MSGFHPYRWTEDAELRLPLTGKGNAGAEAEEVMRARIRCPH
jgi:hypothetical protein